MSLSLYYEIIFQRDDRSYWLLIIKIAATDQYDRTESTHLHHEEEDEDEYERRVEVGHVEGGPQSSCTEIIYTLHQKNILNICNYSKKLYNLKCCAFVHNQRINMIVLLLIFKTFITSSAIC